MIDRRMLMTNEKDRPAANIVIFALGFSVAAVLFSPYPITNPILQGLATLVAVVYVGANIVDWMFTTWTKTRKPK